MKSLYKFFTKSQKVPGTLAEILLHASEEEKMDLFRKAAERANEDQRATFERAQVSH
ncbi:hypothetical protein HY968_03435 [Candidatus Kaiserbacteria bacterium]|nr:hypothetical protein [Candidatus Kaiserbacteria bacterium]